MNILSKAYEAVVNTVDDSSLLYLGF
jgi:hypothetical protein